MALPREHEEAEPSFEHTPAAAIPAGRVDDAAVRVLVGEAWGLCSPVRTLSPTLYLDVQLAAHGRLTLPSLAPELAVYVVQGSLTLDGQALTARQMVVLGQHATELVTAEDVRLVVIGGAALDAPRYMWWNFVSARRERIAQAAEDWQAQCLGQVPGETEFMPAPERRFPA